MRSLSVISSGTATKSFFSFFIIFLLSLPAIAQAEGFETRAKYSILVDDSTDTPLFEKSPDERITPSSMSKLMTLYVLFDKLKKGTVALHDNFRVSEKAWRMQGSKSFMAIDSRVPIEDLIRGIIIQSGNDACIVVAEGIAGSEESFAGEMNAMAAKLALKGSHFNNSTGWPDPEHYMTVHDLAILAHRLIHDFPEYYSYFSEKDYTYNNIHQYNRNLLLTRNIGVDGLKTGHTDDGGFGMVASASRDGRRLIAVVNGLANEKERADESEKLLEYGFREFATVNFFKAGETVETAEVWYGRDKSVLLVAQNDIAITINKASKNNLAAEVLYDSPVAAPIHKGDHIADLVIKREGMGNVIIPLIAANDVEKLSFFGRIMRGIMYRLPGKK